MQIRILAGWKRLMMVLAIASLIIAPAGAAAPVSKAKPASGTPLSSRGIEQQDADATKTVEPVLYQRSSYVWPFSSGPTYGTVEPANWADGSVLHTAVGSFDLTKGLPSIPSELRAENKLDKVPSQYFVMQVKPEAFADGKFDAMKGQIIEQGGTIVEELPIAAFIVRMTAGAHAAVKDSESIAALIPYPPAFKLSPEIGRIPLPDPVKAASSVYSLEVQLFPGEDVKAVADVLKAMGLRVKGNYSDAIFVDADRSKLAAIAGIDQVKRIEEVVPIFMLSQETNNVEQSGTNSTGAVYTLAGIDGGGREKCCPLVPEPTQVDDQILMIIDNGIQLDAGDLSDTRTNPGLDLSGNPIENHRKVKWYGTTVPFGGSGDLLGCDSNTTSGVTHGHTVAVTALGNATVVLPSSTYGTPYQGQDGAGNLWKLDGVAPKARLVAYDGQVTPFTGRCDDVTQIPSPLLGLSPLDPGDLSLALADGYSRGARTVNFSWGTVKNEYDTNATKIDTFLRDNPDVMIFVAAGNAGRDKNGDRIPDPNTIGAPATAKNIICVGAASNADDLNDIDLPNRRWPNSSNGPATIASARIAPLLMAPGTDAGVLGLTSEFHCRSNDNDQSGPVECDVIQGQIGTSVASAAAAGAGLIVRDYFAQGFYPDGTKDNPGNDAVTPAGDSVPVISGTLMKAILVASADWMNQPGTIEIQKPSTAQFGTTPDFFGFTGNLTRKFRGNREQGFGRILLSNVLPLQSYPGTVSGLIVGDGGGAPAGLINSTTLNLNPPASGNSGTYTINVTDTSQPLTVAIAWIDPVVSDVLARDLNLELTSPSGRVYLGNFFTDDVNDNGVILNTSPFFEECTYTGLPWPPNSIGGVVDTGPWSLPVSGAGVSCTAGIHVDHNNNVEAIFLSPDSRINGIYDDPATSVNEASDNQIEQGPWSVIVRNASAVSAQRFSIAIAGGVSLNSAVRIQKVLAGNQLYGSSLTCNDSAVVTVDEVATGGDPILTLTAAEVASRTTLQVIAADGVTVVDSETLAAGDFPSSTTTGSSIRFDSRKILLTDGTAPESGNGVLDIRDGQKVKAIYQDEEPLNGTLNLNLKRVSTADVVCRPLLNAGGVVFGQFGRDAFTLVDGGCEKDARGYFTFGFPDRYMDEGELVSYLLAFQSAEIGADLINVSVSLRAVFADANSPADCVPGSVPTGACTDPNRTNNTCASSKPQTTTPPIVCGTAVMTVLDSPKVYGIVPSGKTITPSFTIQMNSNITNSTCPDGNSDSACKVDMLIGVTAKAAGKGVETLIAKRENLNVDEFAFFYSTDFPLGGAGAANPGGGFVGNFDINNNEILEGTTNDPHRFTNDYFFETQSYSNMTATNDIAVIQAPWNFDTCSTGGNAGVCTGTPAFVNGLQNTSRPGIGTIAQWGEDKNYNGLLDGFCDGTVPGSGFCSLNPARTCSTNANCTSPPPNDGTCTLTHTIPCTQGISVSEGCLRCSLNNAHPCSVIGPTGDAECQGSCSGNINRTCTTNANCTTPPPNDGTCIIKNDGVCTSFFGATGCNFSLGEDRDGADTELNEGWGTAGGCGWQTKAPGDPTGGVWHTGHIDTKGAGPVCLDSGISTSECEMYWATPDGDFIGDNNWWELLLTPVLHKVNLGLDAAGDPLYQVAITDWAWNMAVDIPDTNTSVTMEFDTDINKTSGAELFNDAGVTVAFRGTQGAISGGNAPITGGFNMFARVSHCVDTDGNGSPDHCGTAVGKLCGSAANIDLECTGNDTAVDRGLCLTPPAIKKCTGHPNLSCQVDSDCNRHCSLQLTRNCAVVCSGNLNHQCAANTRCSLLPSKSCNVNADCTLATEGTCTGSECTAAAEGTCTASASGSSNNTCTFATQGSCIDDSTVNNTTSLGERCVSNPNVCTVANQVSDCAGQGGVCVVSGTGNNREGRNNCAFEGLFGTNPPGSATAREPYGLAGPPDDDVANGYCQRSDALNNIDKSVSCTGLGNECNSAGDPYATVRSCSLLTSRICTSNAGCLVCTLNTAKSCATNTDCVTGEGVCDKTTAGVCSNIVYTSSCNLTNHPGTPIDAFVQKNGPGRNYGVQVSNGPDLRFTTLEDFYGETGTAFRAALGFNNREADSSTSGKFPGFGVAVDDMVVSWKESRLDESAPEGKCAASGECATLDTSTNVSFEGNSVVSMTVTDKTPYDSVNVKNDCNGDGDFVDGTDDTDCNNNGANDVVVKLTSDAEVAGELAYLDETSPGSHIYKANFPYSTLYNSPGTLFVVQAGTSPPIVTARYEDRDTIPGATDERCKNALEPSQRGIITAQTTISSTSGRIAVNSYSVVLAGRCSGAPSKDCTFRCSVLTSKACNINSDCLGGEGTCTGNGPECTGGDGVCAYTPGDNDGFADTNETINLLVVFANKSGLDVDDLSATLGTNSPTIECITKSTGIITGVGSPAGSMLNKALSNPVPFQFKVASSATRVNLTDALSALFTVTVRSNKFDALTRATTIPLDLDFSATGGAGSSTFSEDFEAGFGKFTLEYVDANKNTTPLSNGFRCQYNDPFGLNSNSTGSTDCFLGFTADPSTGVNDWHVHTSQANSVGASMGRAWNGTRSLHLGRHLNDLSPNRDTTRLKHIMSVRTFVPVNLPLAGANPELYFKQQVSFVDSTAGVNVSPGEGVDRGVVEIKSSVPANSPWIKIYPYVNVYDEQGTDDFTNCVFDPTDDGNNEDSFFDPTDPARRLGPSSTCFPEFTFVHHGQTDYRKTFDATDIGNAVDGPGLQGCCSDATGCLDPGHANCLGANQPALIKNPGTWVEPRFSLVPYAGRSIFVRFLFSSIEVGGTEFMDGFFGRPDINADDGWYIDDVNITGLLGAGTANAITLSVDTTTISPIACGSCVNIQPTVTASPTNLSAPGQIVTVKAATPSLLACLNGIPQYQFWNHTSGASPVGTAPDILLRDFTDNASFVDAPQVPTTYGVIARCSTDPLSTCGGSNQSTLFVPVTCPTSSASLGSLRVSKTTILGAEPDNNTTISWGGSLTVKLIRGDLTSLRSSGGITNVDGTGCLVNNLFVASKDDFSIIGSGASYFLMQTAAFCNVSLSGAFSENLTSEKPGAANNRDGDIAASPNACP